MSEGSDLQCGSGQQEGATLGEQGEASTAEGVVEQVSLGKAPGWVKAAPWAVVGMAAVCWLVALFWTRHWPMFLDAAIMHYVVFLMDHGWRPYVDIVDLNMPGAYMLEWLVVHSFGGGSAAWRVFDVVTMMVAMAAAAAIPRREDRVAGWLGGVSLALLHIVNGPWDVGERDWSLMVFLLAGSACFVWALRARRPVLMFCFAALSGCAAAIKPPAALLPMALLLLGAMVLRREGLAVRKYATAAVAGALIPLAAVGLFLWHYHAAAAFLAIARGLVPFYAKSGNLPVGLLMRICLGGHLLRLALLAVLVATVARGWRLWEGQALLLGVVVGALLYLGQRKGWQYQKATLFAFLLSWIALQLVRGLRRGGLGRVGGVLGLGMLVLLLVRWVGIVRAYPPFTPVPGVAEMASDVKDLRLPQVSGQVQCVEMVTGCIHALYNMQAVQATGFLFDSFLFAAQPDAPIEALRERFLGELEQRRPAVLIVEASDWQGNYLGYERLERWPAFASFLSEQYELRHEDRQAGAQGELLHGSYRLYVRR